MVVAVDSVIESITSIVSPEERNKEEVCKDAADKECCKTDGVTDEGIISAARWKTGIAAALAIYNTWNSLRMAKMQRDLGERYLELAESYRNYYNERYKPLEEALAKEALALPKYKRGKERLYTGQMMVSARGKTAGRIDKAMSCTGRYCTGQRAAIMTDKLLEQAATESLVAGFAHRHTDNEEKVWDNLRWEKRSAVLNIGRDIPSQAVAYADMAANIFGRVGEQAGRAAEGLVGFIGYDNNRGETRYPQRGGPLTVATGSPKPAEVIEDVGYKRTTWKKPEPEPIKLSG